MTRSPLDLRLHTAEQIAVGVEKESTSALELGGDCRKIDARILRAAQDRLRRACVDASRAAYIAMVGERAQGCPAWCSRRRRDQPLDVEHV